MPRKEQTAVDERKAFITAWQSEEQSVTALCRVFGVSRSTGYKWLERYKSDGETALADLRRAPLFQPRAMPETQRNRILELPAAGSDDVDGAFRCDVNNVGAKRRWLFNDAADYSHRQQK